MPTTRAVRYHVYGKPQVLRIDEVERPHPKAGEVLVRVRATGVHPMDWKLRAGYLQQFMPLQLPYTPGMEFAGTVEEIGDGVTGLVKGDPVFGKGEGTYSEYAIGSAKGLAKKPAQISFEEAATLGVSGVTAWNLVEAAELKPGQRVLIHGGAGGVGSIAVQLAHRKGAHVIATTSAANLDHVRSLGADEVVDYAARPFEQVVHDLDVVLDTVGGEITDRSWAVLKPGGLLISIASMSLDAAASKHGMRTKALPQVQDTAPTLEQLATLVSSGAVRPQVAETYALEQTQDAHAASETGHGRGRRVITVSENM